MDRLYFELKLLGIEFLSLVNSTYFEHCKKEVAALGLNTIKTPSKRLEKLEKKH